MRAAILPGLGKPYVVRDDVEWIRGVEQGEVRVKIAGSGLCRSDLQISTMESTKTPCILGHEAAGVVVEVGPGVTNVAEGDHVILGFTPCGACHWCYAGQANLCGGAAQGMSLTPRVRAGEMEIFPGMPGNSHAEERIVGAGSAIKIGDDVPLDLAALMGCGVITGVGAALNKAKVQPGSSVAVIGTGGVGFNVIQGAHIAGAAVIVAVDIVENRREDAKRFGATHACHPDDLPALSSELTGGRGFDYTFEVIGRSEAFNTALANTRRGGTTVIVGLGDSQLVMTAMDVVVMERTILGSLLGSCDMRPMFHRVLDLWRAGKLDLEGLVTSRIDLSDINDGYAAMEEGVGIRTVITFT